MLFGHAQKLVTIAAVAFFVSLNLQPLQQQFQLLDWYEEYTAAETSNDEVDEYSYSYSHSIHSNSTSIRSWGCNRREAPFIFMHIGKSGGGVIRARIAAAAQDYDRELWHQSFKDKHYYPIRRGENAKFCNSNFKNHWVPDNKINPKSFEGNSRCNATTPLGAAIACPEHGKHRCPGCDDLNSDSCRLVYVSHNFIGAEMHWLPPKYLQNWWDKSPWSVPAIDEVWENLLPESEWCGTMPRPTNQRDFDAAYKNCSQPMAAHFDRKFKKYWRKQQHQQQQIASSSLPTDYSPIYASLPVQRVTVVREPFSWLLSKFFFHQRFREGYVCDQIEEASTTWALQYTLLYICFLCGDDCLNRYENGLASLEDIEAQAAGNLRNSFSVVGLLSDVDGFYDMIAARTAYVDTSLNLHVEGDSHARRLGKEATRCSDVFHDTGFQQDFKDSLPSLAAVERLFEVAVEVNRFQKEELEQCETY